MERRKKETEPQKIKYEPDYKCSKCGRTVKFMIRGKHNNHINKKICGYCKIIEK